MNSNRTFSAEATTGRTVKGLAGAAVVSCAILAGCTNEPSSSPEFWGPAPYLPEYVDDHYDDGYGYYPYTDPTMYGSSGGWNSTPSYDPTTHYYEQQVFENNYMIDRLFDTDSLEPGQNYGDPDFDWVGDDYDSL
jgi:hypothetical protein